MHKAKRIELFCGTGGVGKTTLAASRALYLARKKKTVLLMTIDPSLRLKQLFSLDEEDSDGLAKEITTNDVDLNGGRLMILLMNNEATLKYALGQTSITNHILKSLSRPYSGMNEILSLIELARYINQNEYDHIILDTPPGKHFVDFIASAEKINHFFDKSFIRIFMSVKKEEKGIFSTVIGSGIKKILTYLEKVTGEGFVDTFIDALITLFERKDYFLEGLASQKVLNDRQLCQWYLVSSIEQHKSMDLKSFTNSLNDASHSSGQFILNKSLKEHLEQWDPADNELLRLKATMLKRENELEVKQSQWLIFPEIIDPNPAVHMKQLCLSWQRYETSQR
jgi:anion-transporting  ArsA/GET3 family ATPase